MANEQSTDAKTIKLVLPISLEETIKRLYQFPSTYPTFSYRSEVTITPVDSYRCNFRLEIRGSSNIQLQERLEMQGYLQVLNKEQTLFVGEDKTSNLQRVSLPIIGLFTMLICLISGQQGWCLWVILGGLFLVMSLLIIFSSPTEYLIPLLKAELETLPPLT